MKPVHVAALALVALVAGMVIWFSGQSDAPVVAEDKALFTDLAVKLDDISQLKLSDAAGATVTIERKGKGWMVREASRYHADVGKVGELVVAVSEAVTQEQKTSNPEFYERLGVQDIANADSEAVLLSIQAGGQSYDVLIGNQSDRFGGSTFVRKPDSAASLLVSPSLRVSTDASSWQDKQVLDFPSEEIQSVVIEHGDSTTEIVKDSPTQTSFTLVGKTDDQKLQDTLVRGVGRGLAGLSFEDVRRGAAFAINDYQRKSVKYTLFSGVVVQVTLFYKLPEEETEDSEGPPAKAEYWLNAGVRFDESIAQQFAPQPTATVDGTEPQTLTLTPADLADRQREADELNDKIRMWMYKITSARFDSINKTTEELIDTPEE